MGVYNISYFLVYNVRKYFFDVGIFGGTSTVIASGPSLSNNVQSPTGKSKAKKVVEQVKPWVDKTKRSSSEENEQQLENSKCLDYATTYQPIRIVNTIKSFTMENESSCDNLEKYRKKHNLPPGPPGIPIIGNLHQLSELAHQSLHQLSKIYGPIIFLKLGRVPTVVVSSPDCAKQVLATHDLECCSRPLLSGTGRLSYNYLDVAFTPYGDYWREIKKFCVLELFCAKRVQSFRFIREEEVELMINSISQHSSSLSTPIDLSQKMLSLMADITCRLAFGTNFRSKGEELNNDKFHEIVRQAFVMLGSFSAADFFPYIGWMDHHNYDVIDSMLDFHKNQTESSTIKFTDNHIKAVLMNIFLAGVDTSVTTTIFAMSELARNPRVMKKAQEELRSNVGSKDKVSEWNIEKLSYLKLIIKETLRLHSPGPLLIPREAISKFKINGYTIYPGTRIYVNVWGIGRDPNIWENPEKFIPERFEDNPIDYKGQHFEYLPFGGGRRGCPGVVMAMSNIELALANLLHCFDWKLPDGMKEEDISMEEGHGLSIYKKEPLQLLPIKYKIFSAGAYGQICTTTIRGDSRIASRGDRG
ncbi:hypothetical protein ACFE04_027148 [Oxalis oulophora]